MTFPEPPRASSRGTSSRYELIHKIASGGMATVYLARSLELDRIVAVKRAHSHLLDEPGARDAVLREARLASRVRHANVASVHDVEDTGEDVLLVMEYVEGASLAELLDAARECGRSIAASVAVRIVLDVAYGLSALHELVGDDGRALGMVHRDVSPQNVLVGLDGTSRVADFGLAKLVAARDATRSAGSVPGKLAYLAPELLDGMRASPQSEIFALGVVAWEALASSRLFRGDSDAETIRRIVTMEAAPLSHAAPHLGTTFDSVLGRALARRPNERYESVRAFSTEFEAVSRHARVIATSAEVSHVVATLAGPKLERRREILGAALAVSRVAGTSDPKFADTAAMNGPPPEPVSIARLAGHDGALTGTSHSVAPTFPAHEARWAVADVGAARAGQHEPSVSAPNLASAHRVKPNAPAKPWLRGPWVALFGVALGIGIGVSVAGRPREPEPASIDASARVLADGPTGEGSAPRQAASAGSEAIPDASASASAIAATATSAGEAVAANATAATDNSASMPAAGSTPAANTLGARGTAARWASPGARNSPATKTPPPNPYKKARP